MKVTVQTQTIYNIELTLEEALWLKAAIQNGPENESNSSLQMRRALFTRLPAQPDPRDTDFEDDKNI